MMKLTLKFGVLCALFCLGLADAPGPYKMKMGYLEPRSFENDVVKYDCQVKPSPENKAEKLIYLTFDFFRDVGPLSASVSVYRDKSQNKQGDWESPTTMPLRKKICEVEHGVKNFLEHINPRKVFDEKPCGIFKSKNVTVHGWTIDKDLHAAFDKIHYGWYKIKLCLTDDYDPMQGQWNYENCFLEFEVFGDIISDKACADDDEECKEKEKKKQEKEKEKKNKKKKKDKEGKKDKDKKES